MFLDLFYLLRQQGIPVSVTEWLSLLKGLSKGLAHSNLHEFYYLSRSILIKDEKYYDRFDEVFLHYFKGKEAPAPIRDDILSWLKEGIPDMDSFLATLPNPESMDLEELLSVLKKRLEEQTDRHDGGSKWIGTGGASPFGWGGRRTPGIRVGGIGGGRLALQIIGERRFRRYRNDRILDVRQMKVALKKLKRLVPDGQFSQLDIPDTIDKTCKNGGDIDLSFKKPKKNSVKVALIMDVGGSMEPYARLVEQLFSAASTVNHFKKFTHYYFHNCVYETLWTCPTKRENIATATLLNKLAPETLIIFCGDGCMAWSELVSPYGAINYSHHNEKPGIYWLNAIKNRFSKVAWLNPIRKNYWDHPTIRTIASMIPMFPLTLDGIDDSVDYLRKNRNR